jgi:hypothetical protein
MTIVREYRYELTHRTGFPALSMIVALNGRCVRSVCLASTPSIDCSSSAKLDGQRGVYQSVVYSQPDKLACGIMYGVSICLFVLRHELPPLSLARGCGRLTPMNTFNISICLKAISHIQLSMRRSYLTITRASFASSSLAP